MSRRCDMLGNIVGEAHGKITGVKVLEFAGDHSKLEVNFQGDGKLADVGFRDIATYWQEMRPGGVIYGEGGIVIMTDDGELLSWKGFGVGKPTGPGFSASFAPCGSIQTSSERFAHLNGVSTIGEYEVDEAGNYHWTMWELERSEQLN
jgi:hypothetical protein